MNGEIIATIPIKEVARQLRTTPAKVKAAIINGTMPIGMVGSESTRDTTIIIAARWERWKKGEM